MKFIIFVTKFLLVFCLFPNYLFAQPELEGLEQFWIENLPMVTKAASSIDSADIQVVSWSDMAIYTFENAKTNLEILCHYHPTTKNCHCNFVENFVVPENNRLILDLPAQEITEILNQFDITQISQRDPVWPWVLGALASFYISKKIINYWIYKSFKPREHSHSFSFLDKTTLKSKLESDILIAESHLQGLDAVFEVNLNLNFSDGDKIKALLEERIQNLTGEIIRDLAKSLCSTCNQHHLPNEENVASQSYIGLKINSPIRSNNAFSPTEIGKIKYQIVAFSEKKSREGPISNKSKTRTDLALDLVNQGLVIKYTKALLLDIHKEMIQAIPKGLKGVYKTVSNTENLKQLHSFAQTKFNSSVGESNTTTAFAIVTSLVIIKIIGETLESVFFGPYHVFCQISDTAAISAGILFLTSYHSFRQAFRHRKPELFFQKKFWSSIIEKIKNPSLDSKLFANQGKNGLKSSETLLIEMEKLQSHLQKLIWELRESGSLSKTEANQLAQKLGKISKSKEDIIFDLKIIEAYTSEDLLVIVDRLKIVYQEYKLLYEAATNRNPIYKENVLMKETIFCRSLNFGII